MDPSPRIPKFLAPPPRLTGPALTVTTALPMANNGALGATVGSNLIPPAVKDR